MRGRDSEVAHTEQHLEPNNRPVANCITGVQKDSLIIIIEEDE